MHKIVLLLTLIIMGITSSFAQNDNTIIETRVGNRITYTCNGISLSEKQVLEKTKRYPDAYKEMKKYKTNRAFGTVFSYTGSFLIGWSVGAALGNGESQWGIAAIGAGVIALGIPFYIATPKRKKRGIELYNNHVQPSTAHQVEFNFGLNNYGVGVSMKF